MGELTNENGRKYLTWRDYSYATSGIVVVIATLIVSLLSIYFTFRPTLITASELQSRLSAPEQRINDNKETLKELKLSIDVLKANQVEIKKNQAVMQATLDRIAKKLD